MKAKTLNRCLATLLILCNFACAPSNPSLMQPQKTYSPLSSQAFVNGEVVPARKVDILFVIDDSVSMREHVQDLKRSGLQFAQTFAKDSADIDFHVGVTLITDLKSIRSMGNPVECPAIGKLQPLRDPNCPVKEKETPLYSQFITRDTGIVPFCPEAAQKRDPAVPPFESILANSISVPIRQVYTTVDDNSQGAGIIAQYKNEGPKRRLCGAEYEEDFTPVMQALRPEVNPGFYRPEANLAIIFMTDAGDDSTIAADDLAQQLIALKNGHKEMVSTYAALSLSQGCEKDGSGIADAYVKGRFYPGKIRQLLNLTGGRAPFDLCDRDFGNKLAQTAADIRIQLESAKTFYMPLPNEPDPDRTQVSVVTAVGKTVLPNNKFNGWIFNVDTGQLQIPYSVLPKGAKIQIQTVNIDPKADAKGQVPTQ